MFFSSTGTKKFNHVPVELLDLQSQQDNEGKRFYQTPNGVWYPSITTVLSYMNKDSLMAWRKRVGEEEANRISSAAMERGTRLHSICENYIKNDLDLKSISPFDMPMFKSIKPILDSNIDKIHAQEAALYSEYLSVAGRVDLVANYDGKLSIIDFKTSRKVKKKEYITNYFMQAAAYAVMFEERTGLPIGRIVIIMAVEDEPPIVFVEKRDNYIFDFIKFRRSLDIKLDTKQLV